MIHTVWIRAFKMLVKYWLRAKDISRDISEWSGPSRLSRLLRFLRHKIFKIPRTYKISKTYKTFQISKTYKTSKTYKISKTCKTFKIFDIVKISKTYKVSKICKISETSMPFKISKTSKLSGVSAYRILFEVFRIVRHTHVSDAIGSAWQPITTNSAGQRGKSTCTSSALKVRRVWRQRVPEGVLRLPTLAYIVKDRAVRGMPLLHPSLLSSYQYQATLSVNLPSSLSEKANLVSYSVKNVRIGRLNVATFLSVIYVIAEIIHTIMALKELL